MRPSPSALFVVGAIATAAGVGMLARSASGAEDAASASSGSSALPSDAARLGFMVTATANDVGLLEASRPFRIELGNGPVHGSPAGPARLARARDVVARELARFPRAFLHAIRLRGVVLTSELAEGERAIPSLPNVGGLLLFDVDGTERDLVRGLHHEIFHFADLADDGRLSPDPSWEAINAPAFVYGAGGRTLRGAWAAEAPAAGELPGFVSAYATSGVEEDKAETFAFALARPAAVRARAAADPVLRDKLAELARRMVQLGLPADQIPTPPR